MRFHRDDRDIEGNGRANDLRGSNAAEEIRGRGGNDALFGGGGADRLRGDKGDDRLTGGAGRDRFIFNTGGGGDAVTDFTEGQDRLDLTNFGFGTAAEALAAAAQDGGDVVLAIGDVTITLRGVAPGSLDAGDLLL